MIFLLVAAETFASQETSPSQTATQTEPPPRLNLQLDACPQSAHDEIVVCARRRNDDRYRIPQMLRDGAVAGQPIVGLAPKSLDADAFAPCGIFRGEGRCNKKEAAHYGYGGGWDPLAVAGRIVSEIVGPD